MPLGDGTDTRPAPGLPPVPPAEGTAVPPKRARRPHRRVRRLFDPMMLPVVVVILAVIGYPIYRAVSLSFDRYNLNSGAPPAPAGSANYSHLVHDPLFRQALEHSAVYAAATVGCAATIGLILALATENLRGPWRILRTVLLTPWAVPLIVVAFLFSYVLDEKQGIVNQILVHLHIVHAAVPWLNSSTWAMVSVIVANVWTQTPFFLLVFTAALAGVPNEVIEAARVDKASGWAMLRYIKLPYLRTAGMVGGLIMVISNFNNFTTIWSMTSGGPAYSTTTLVIYVYRLAFESFNVGYSSAVGVIWLLLLVLFAIAYIRLMQRQSVGTRRG